MATEPEESDDGSFTLMCWNINGLLPTLPNIRLKHPGRGNPLASFFKQYRLDAVCFQEMKMPTDKMTAEIACVPGFESFWAISQERQSYSGVTTWLRSPPWSPRAASAEDLGAVTGADLDLDREGRIVTTDLGAFVLVNVYVPNAGDPPERPRLAFKCRFLNSLRVRLDQLRNEGKQVICVGDFNVAAERRDMHSTYNYDNMYSAQELQLLHSIMEDFLDLWRHLHTDTLDCYTVWEERTNARAFNAGTRIDYVLVSKGLLDKVVSCEILYDLPPKWSDHAPLLLKLQGVQGLGPQPPCDLSSRRMPRFNPPNSIIKMFATAQQRGAKKQKVVEKDAESIKDGEVQHKDGRGGTAKGDSGQGHTGEQLPANEVPASSSGQGLVLSTAQGGSERDEHATAAAAPQGARDATGASGVRVPGGGSGDIDLTAGERDTGCDEKAHPSRVGDRAQGAEDPGSTHDGAPAGVQGPGARSAAQGPAQASGAQQGAQAQAGKAGGRTDATGSGSKAHEKGRKGGGGKAAASQTAVSQQKSIKSFFKSAG